MPATAEHRIGLRFRRSQARTLRALAERAERRELGAESVSLFRDAADAAATGEPLIVLCEQPLEAVLIAEGFTRYGVVKPAVEELSGDRVR